MPSNQLLTKLAETNDTESRRYQEAMDCGDALVRELESSGLSVLGSGRTLERKQMTELLPDLSESFRRLTS